MLPPRLMLSMSLAGIMVLGAGMAAGQEYPNKPIRIVTSAPGGGNDFTAPNIVLVHPSLPVKSVKELIALAKARPGELNYSSSAAGVTQHLSAELFKSMAGVNIVRVAYKGAGPGLIGLVGGETQVMISTAPSSAPHIKSGKVRALAVTSAQPSALAALMKSEIVKWGKVIKEAAIHTRQ